MQWWPSWFPVSRREFQFVVIVAHGTPIVAPPDSSEIAQSLLVVHIDCVAVALELARLALQNGVSGDLALRLRRLPGLRAVFLSRVGGGRQC